MLNRRTFCGALAALGIGARASFSEGSSGGRRIGVIGDSWRFNDKPLQEGLRKTYRIVMQLERIDSRYRNVLAAGSIIGTIHAVSKKEAMRAISRSKAIKMLPHGWYATGCEVTVVAGERVLGRYEPVFRIED